MIPKSNVTAICLALWCCTVASVAGGQEAAGSRPQTPLGDMVRQERDHEHSKAKRVVTDDDVPSTHMHRMRDQVAENRIIPAIRISGLAPDDTSQAATPVGQKRDRIYVGFGPHLTNDDTCDAEDSNCSEELFLSKYERGGWAGSRTKILFDTDDAVQQFPARIAHFEVVHPVRGKMRGMVAFIATPIAPLSASCLYKVEDEAEAEPECETFISSLEVEIPEKYIYVEHH